MLRGERFPLPSYCFGAIDTIRSYKDMKKDMKQKSKLHIHQDVYTSLFLIGLSAFFIIYSTTYPDSSIGLFPNIFAVVLITVSIPTLISGIRQTHKLRQMSSEENDPSVFKAGELPQALFGYVILVLYAISIQFIGFYVSTTAFLVSMMLLLNVRKVLMLTLVPLGVDLFLYFFVAQQLAVRFPRGILF